MKANQFLILALSALIGCSVFSGNDNPSKVNIRLSNVSPYTYQDIRVSTTGDDVNFGDLRSSQFTDYSVFETAYRYAFVELQINDSTYTLQPIDYVGETPLKSGRYTYQIDADDSEDRFSRLSLTLIED
ncbi:MAG: hypothetical protein U5K71_15355 [Gracilimonas sp.]|nr:hypothetical protein [Gracilimonas sp.]